MAKKKKKGLPGGPMVRLCAPLQGTGSILHWEPRSHMPGGAKNLKERGRAGLSKFYVHTIP